VEQLAIVVVVEEPAACGAVMKHLGMLAWHGGPVGA
jgi:hypothetical protein